MKNCIAQIKLGIWSMNPICFSIQGSTALNMLTLNRMPTYSSKYITDLIIPVLRLFYVASIKVTEMIRENMNQCLRKFPSKVIHTNCYTHLICTCHTI